MNPFAVSNCLNNIDATSSTSNELIKLLKDNDFVIVNQTVKTIHQYLEKGDQRIILNTRRLIPSLVDVLNSWNDLETIEYTTKILRHLSQYQPDLMSIYQSNGIPTLINLLRVPVNSVVTHSVITLHNLLLDQECSKATVRDAGGLQKMVMLLSHHNEKFLIIVTDCLKILACQNQDNKLIILSWNGPAELVRILGTYESKTLLWSTSRVLKVLSACSSNKLAIIAAEGIQVLGRHLGSLNKKLLINCLWTLRNLSNAAANEVNLKYVLKGLVKLLERSDKSIVSCTAEILSNLTCNNARNKVIICQENGVVALVNAIITAENKEEIIEPAICTLRHLTSHHPEAETVQNDVRLHSGLQTIIKFLHPPRRWPLIKAVIGLVRNIAFSPNTHETLRAFGIVHTLRDLLILVYQDILRVREGFSNFETQLTVIEGVKMEEIVEGILRAFLNLAQNINVRDLLKDRNIMDTFVKILNKENESIQCIVIGIFCEIVSNPYSILIVESAGIVPFLCTSLRSNNKNLASQSKFLLVQLFTLKPQQYEHLSDYMRSIMEKVDSVPWHGLQKSSSNVTNSSKHQFRPHF